MTGVRFADLVDDLRGRGLLEPITLHEGMILEGRNRYRACLEADVTPRFKQFTGGKPLTFVISMNLRRRHLSQDERKKIAVVLLADDPASKATKLLWSRK
jgi:ParB-like chromosome segregation protein Spo0J